MTYKRQELERLQEMPEYREGYEAFNKPPPVGTTRDQLRAWHLGWETARAEALAP